MKLLSRSLETRIDNLAPELKTATRLADVFYGYA